MNKQTMLYIKNSRENLIGFLYIVDIQKLNTLFNDFYKVDKKSWIEICDKCLSLYDNGAINNKSASKIFEILMQSNTSIRIESHRYESGSIFEYSTEKECYLFLKKGNNTEFNKLNHYL